MADLTLRWFVKGQMSEYGAGRVEAEGAYRIPDGEDYVPVLAYLHQRVAPEDEPTVIDINDDGVSIFNERPQLNGVQEKVWTTIDENIIRGGSVITLDIDGVSSTTPGEDLTVQLELNKV